MVEHKVLIQLEMSKIVIPKKSKLHKKIRKIQTNDRTLHRHRQLSSPIAKALALVSNQDKLDKANALLAFSDEKESKVDLVKEAKMLKSMVRGLLGNSVEYDIDLYTFTALSTSMSQILQVALPGGGNVRQMQALGSATNQPEWADLANLFDEYKVMGMSCEYYPVNPFSHYIFTTSVFTGYVPTTTFAVLFDDDNVNASPTNTLTALSLFAARGSLVHFFEPDLYFKRTFMRPGKDTDYIWDDCQAPGTTNAGLGGIQLTSDGNSGLSGTQVPFGSMKFIWHMKFRTRI